MSKVLAITGGIGCGKSYIIKIFAALGIPVYLSDDRTKELYSENDELRKGLEEMLGASIFKMGKLQRQEMAKKIFSDKELLAKVEAFVHPYVKRDFEDWIEEQKKNNVCFMIHESAIFLEKDIFRNMVDKVMVISSPLEVRIERAMSRDGVTYEEVMARIQHQWTDEQREKEADYIVVSDGKKPILPQVMKIYNELWRITENG